MPAGTRQWRGYAAAKTGPDARPESLRRQDVRPLNFPSFGVNPLGILFPASSPAGGSGLSPSSPPCFALVLPVSLLSHLPRDAVAPEPPHGVRLAPPPTDRMARRDALFRETLAERLQRVALGAAWSLQPERIDRLVPLAQLCMRHLLEPDDTLPDLAKTPAAPELVGIADDLSVATLAEAYAKGL